MAKRRTLSSIMTDDFSVGAGLLNTASENQSSTLTRSKYIPVSDIVENEKNKMSLNNIEELASQIELAGLEQPLVVRQRDDGKYVILTGHRRFAAIKLLQSRGKWNEDGLVEVKVKNFDSWDINVSEDTKEMFSILTTNQYRTKTDADRAFEIREWKKIIAEFRKNGIETLVVGLDEEGNAIEKNIHGESTKNIIAEQMGISPAQVAKFTKVEKNGSKQLQEALQNNAIPIAVAASVASRDVEEQDAILASVKDKKNISKTDVDEAAKKIAEAKSGSGDYYITEQILRKDLQPLIVATRGKEIKLNSKTYKKYQDFISKLNDILTNN